MKILYTFTFALLLVINLKAQDQVSVNAGYMMQTYYSIATGETTQADPLSWDIAFSLGAQDAGVFVNEAVGLSFTEALPQVELYLPVNASSTEYENADTTGMERIYNNEVTWEEGAFNHVKDETNMLDAGWGLFDLSNFTTNSLRYFVIKLRNGAYKKVEIQSLIAGVYTFRYADLDGSNESVQTIDKSNYNGETLAYFSIQNNEEVDLEPEEWDLLFTRYAILLDGNEGFINYTVTGVLSNKGVEVIELNGVVDPTAVNYMDHEDLFTDSLTVIGHDWKSFDFQEGWVIPTDKLFFIKSNDVIWRVVFIDFEGSSTGVSTLIKEEVGTVTAIEDTVAGQHVFEMYPNPATDFIDINFSSDTQEANGFVQIFNNLGQSVYSERVYIQQGRQQKRINFELPTGNYFLSLGYDDQIITQTFTVR